MSKRASLTPKERAAMLAEQQGKCAKCSCAIGPQPDGSKIPFIAEHWTCVAFGNHQKPDCLLCLPCALAKTRRDVKAIAKVRRLRGETKQGPKKKIASRGFAERPEGHRYQWPSRKVGA